MGIGIIGSNWSVNEHTADFLAFANMEALARGGIWKWDHLLEDCFDEWGW